MHKFIVIVFSISLFACNGQKKVAKSDNHSQQEQLAFRYEKTPCFGTCPEYILTVWENGKAQLEGKKNTDLIGTFNCDDCDQEMMLKVMETAGRIKFWQMKDKYDPGVTDLPSTITTIYLKKPPKTVVNVMDAPKELAELEQQIEDYYLKRNWSKTN